MTTFYACDGGTVLGIAQVLGDYQYESSGDFPNRRTVEWLSLEEWKMPKPEGLETTVYEMRKSDDNILEAERRAQKPRTAIPTP